MYLMFNYMIDCDLIESFRNSAYNNLFFQKQRDHPIKILLIKTKQALQSHTNGLRQIARHKQAGINRVAG